MIELLDGMPEGTLGFRVDDDIEKEDYTEVLVPKLKAAAERGEIRALYLIEDIDEMEAGALWEDAKLGAGLEVHHRSAFKRNAIVTDIPWMAKASKLFLWMIPGEAAVYPVAQLEEAKAWIAG